jgi:5'-nucleotidase
MTRPLILLSNDDGFDSHGIVLLKAELERFAQVVLCAPATNQSASSHALTLHRVLRLRRYHDDTFSVDGTPADCVYVALHSGDRILPRWPDMVVSGLNRGPNLGVDVVYSGTVAAAREGAQRGIPAVAASAASRADTAKAAALAARVVERAWRDIEGDEQQLPAPLLNVNIPPGDSWELRSTQLGRRLYDDDVIYRKDPRDHEYLWIGGAEVQHERRDGTDTDAWEHGRASVTPLTLDLTAHQHESLAARIVEAASR